MARRRECLSCGARIAAGEKLCSECGSRIGRERSRRVCPCCGAQTDGSGPCPVCGAVERANGDRNRGWMPQAAWAAASIVVLVAIWLVGVRSGALGDLVRTGVSRVLSRRVEATAVGPKAASPTAEVLTSWAVKATETMATSTDATETPTFVPTLTRTASVTPTATFTSTATRTPAATASPTAALPSATPRIHVVVSGDYIEKLAVVYDVDQDAIAAANGITLETILQLGQELVIPAPGESPEATAVPPGSPTPTPGLTATSSDEKAVALPTVSTPTKALTATSSPTPRPAGRPATHTVSEGENLSYLAMKYDVSMQEIAEANDIAGSQRRPRRPWRQSHLRPHGFRPLPGCIALRCHSILRRATPSRRRVNCC